jgi:hypothetical protein
VTFDPTDPDKPVRGVRLTAALLADYANVTTDGKLNVMGVFGRMTVTRLPITYPSLYLVARFEARVTEGTRHTVQVALVDTDGQEVVPKLAPIPLHFQITGPGRPLRAQLLMEFADLRLPVLGEYDFHIFVDGEYLESVPLYLESVSEPAG